MNIVPIVSYKIPDFFWACPLLVKNAKKRSGCPGYTVTFPIPHAVIPNKVKYIKLVTKKIN